MRARALALSRLGRHAEAAEELAELVAERPRDEEVLLELLRGEAATLGPSAALARYEVYRRSLRDELGSDPGPALQAVHRQLLQGEAPAVRVTTPPTMASTSPGRPAADRPSPSKPRPGTITKTGQPTRPSSRSMA